MAGDEPRRPQSLCGTEASVQQQFSQQRPHLPVAARGHERTGRRPRQPNSNRPFRELQFYGFIVLIRPGRLGSDGKGTAPHWRLTECGYLKDPPTRDFMRWNGVRESKQLRPSLSRLLAGRLRVVD